MSGLLELAEHWEGQCNRYLNGKCHTRRCLVRGGWQTGPVDYSLATCEEHETATLLRTPDAQPSSTDEVERVIEALTQGAATKAAYIGEFSFTIDEQSDDQMCQVSRTVDVPWTTIKEIMAAIRDRAAIASMVTK